MMQLDYKDFLGDYAKELIDMTKDVSIYSNEDAFTMGYRAALYASINALECQLKAWGVDPADIGFGEFSADEWKARGIKYWDADA